MSTNSYSGSALVVTWFQGSGTNIISGDQTTFDYTPSIDLIDQTSGADSNKKYINGVKDGQVSMSSYFQSGTNLRGTATWATLTEGLAGTLMWQPEGTATTKPKYTIPAISKGVGFSHPYADKVTASISFQQNGTRVEGTN
ncbi:MAG: hypothetical protein WC554_11845 [Clostridia bacterium]